MAQVNGDLQHVRDSNYEMTMPKAPDLCDDLKDVVHFIIMRDEIFTSYFAYEAFLKSIFIPNPIS